LPITVICPVSLPLATWLEQLTVVSATRSRLADRTVEALLYYFYDKWRNWNEGGFR